VAEQQKKVATVQTETENALAFFEQSGVMKQKDLENARSSLQSYFTAKDKELQNEIDIAKITGFFQGKPTLEREKMKATTAPGAPGGIKLSNTQKLNLLGKGWTATEIAGMDSQMAGFAYNADTKAEAQLNYDIAVNGMSSDIAKQVYGNLVDEWTIDEAYRTIPLGAGIPGIQPTAPAKKPSTQMGFWEGLGSMGQYIGGGLKKIFTVPEEYKKK